MAASELQRSVRRSVAILLVPQSLLLVRIEIVTDTLAGTVESGLPAVSRTIGVVVLVGAVLYLPVSVAMQASAAADTPF